MIVQEEILDADEVARLLHVHQRTVKRLAAKRRLPGFQVGGQWRFRLSDIEEYIDRQVHGKPVQEGEDL